MALFKKKKYKISNIENLSIEDGWVIVNVSDLDGERADALERWIALVGGLDGDGHILAVFAFTVEDFVSEDLARLLVHGEFSDLLVRLPHNGILDLHTRSMIRYSFGKNIALKSSYLRKYLAVKL